MEGTTRTCHTHTNTYPSPPLKCLGACKHQMETDHIPPTADLNCLLELYRLECKKKTK